MVVKERLGNQQREDKDSRHIDIKDGFDLRHYNDKLLIKPQKEKNLAFCKKIGKTLAQMKTKTQKEVIKTLNPLLLLIEALTCFHWWQR